MTPYKHTQIGYLILIITLATLLLFVSIYLTALAEPVSVDSGPNLLVSAIMILIVLTLASFSALTVSVNEKYIKIKFGCGIFYKSFALSEIASVKQVKNRWYYGWGIRLWLRPHMWIYNVSGFDAIELIMKNGKVYRIGTNDPIGLKTAIEGR